MNSTYQRQRSNVETLTVSPGRLIGIVLPAGRVASDRKEIFIGQGIQTPSEGIALLPEHRSKIIVMRFDPVRGDDGSLTIDHRLPDSPEGRAMAAAVRSGATPGLSVEFTPWQKLVCPAFERFVNLS